MTAEASPLCASAERPARRPAVRLGLFVTGAALLLAGGYLLHRGYPALAVPALLVFGGAALLWDVFSEKRLPRYAISPLWLERGSEGRKLSELRRVDLDWYRSRVVERWTPALRLHVGSEVWHLPLSLEGWDGFWDCLRALRPDLGLPDWRHLKPMRTWLAEHRRYNLALPATVEVSRPSFTVQTVAGLAAVSLLDLAWGHIRGGRNALESAFLAAAGLWLSDHLLRRFYPPRIVAAPWLNDPERTETSSSQE